MFLITLRNMKKYIFKLTANRDDVAKKFVIYLEMKEQIQKHENNGSRIRSKWKIYLRR